MEPTDPYDADELEPVAPPKGKRKVGRVAIAPGEAEEGDQLDTVLALKPLNDFGNATRLIERFGEDLMHVENIGWYSWDDARWDREGGGAHAFKLGHRVSQGIAQEAKALEKSRGKDYAERVDKLFGWSVQTGNTSRVHSMLAGAAPYLNRSIDDLDARPMLVAAANGTIRLGTHCELRPAERHDLLTRVLGVSYNTRAQCPLFEKFLCEIMPDEAMREFLRRIMGYCLTGEMIEHKLFILFGTGRNGKTLFLNLMRFVFKLYATSLPPASILASRDMNSGGDATPDLADLPGIRLVTVSEPKESARLGEARIKDVTGGEHRMKVRRLHEGFFEFAPQFKMIVATNHRPIIRGTDDGIWSRIVLVPFTVCIPKEKIDPHLEKKLLPEAEGILQWILGGVEDWCVRGLEPPQSVLDAVTNYRDDQNPVGEFVAARCEVARDEINPGTGRRWEVLAKDVWNAYKLWCKDEGIEALSQQAFGSKLSGMGVERRKTGGVKVYVGLRLYAPHETTL